MTDSLCGIVYGDNLNREYNMALSGLLVGLGNPGQAYAGTRHNLGFLCIDELLQHMDAVTSQSGNRFHCLLWKARFAGMEGEWLLAKPQTFMNLSGDAVQPLAAWHRIPPARILVIHDELDLPPGRMKFKCGGGHAGHNGLKSIAQRLGTPDFWRLRLGIGRPENSDIVSWVLGKPSRQAGEAIALMLPDAVACIQAFASGNSAEATRLANAHTTASL